MVTRTRTIVTYVCDLCGSEHDDESGITAVYADRPEGQARGMRNRRFQVDVCQDCLSRPIADVLAFCAGGHAGEVRSVSKRGVVRIADG